ncbi:MAG: RNA-binding protein [Nitrospira sp.]|nr:RNA-binding protein [Nitrospira sp.]MCY3955483.1 RNA-binding protein [Nitrospira sp.]MCY4132308.1 RNA-binding protein [Nitrospira sp.]
MPFKIYVGGLPYPTTETELTDLFVQHGNVDSAKIITDKYTGRSRGFGFVEMPSEEEGKAAIAALNGTQLDGRTLTVNQARPQEARVGGGRGGFGGRGGRHDR